MTEAFKIFGGEGCKGPAQKLIAKV